MNPEPDQNRDDLENKESGHLARVVDIRSKLLPDSESGSEPGSASEPTPEPVSDVVSITNRAMTFESEVEAEYEPEAELPEINSYATKVLARKAMSSGELQRALAKAGYPDVDIEIVIEEFKTSLYLDDLGLARIVAEKLRENKKASKNQIKQALRQRFFDESAVVEVLDEFDDEEESDLLWLAALDRAKKMRGVPRAAAERRLIGFLSRRGWGGSEVYKVVREALDEVAVSDGR